MHPLINYRLNQRFLNLREKSWLSKKKAQFSSIKSKCKLLDFSNSADEFCYQNYGLDLTPKLSESGVGIIENTRFPVGLVGIWNSKGWKFNNSKFLTF